MKLQTMMKDRMNKKAAEDLATWMIVFPLIVLIYLGFLFFVLINYGEQSVFGDENKIVVEENTLYSVDYQLFFIFLNKEIAINNEKTTVIGGIKQSINPFFEIKNDRGEHFIGIFGIQKLKQPGSDLQNDMYARGFDEEDLLAIVDAQHKFQESELVMKITELLDKDCKKYFLKIPFGVITNESLKNIDESVFENSESKLLLYMPTLKYTTYYKGEAIEILFRKSVDCL